MNFWMIIRSKRNCEESRGFTMIELMIVMAIIAILAAVAIPNFMRSRDRARITACIDQLSSLKTAAEDFMVEKGSLRQLDKWQDLCAHIYAGVDDPATCNDPLESRIDTICDGNSFNWFQPDDFYYEITANAKTTNHCFICITSDVTIPESNDIPKCPVQACP